MQSPLFYLGFFIAKGIDKSKFIKRKVSNFEVFVKGFENLEKFKNTPYILASNHIRPQDNGLYNMGISADSFILQKIIGDNFNTNLSSVMGFGIENSRIIKVFESIERGLVIGLNNIAVKKGDKESFRNDFLKGVEKCVIKNNPILIHPVGEYHDDFEENHKLKAGAAYVALKYNLPIIPVYINGCTHWNKKGQKVNIFFGKPVAPKGTVDEINEKIKAGILELKTN